MKLRFLFIGVIVLIITINVYKYVSVHSSIEQAPSYVGSESCKDCHQIYFESWKHNTLHPKIFQPVKEQSQILGDFENKSPLVNFTKDEIEYVVGSKWEQVYMRMIDGEYYPFTAKWMVTTQKWVPYKVHDWKETPASTKCNGCHTTGFNSNTFEFNEFGVSCESCHGAGSHHVNHKKMDTSIECFVCHDTHKEFHEDIIVSQKSTVCGQCHSRGKTSQESNNGKMTSFNFPLNYKPGDEISNNFVATSIQNDQKGKNWWGNGVSKNRHQEFADFSFSKHVKALDDLRQKKNPHGGEKSDECLKCHSQDYRSAPKGEKPTIESAKYGLTCVTCHEPHGMDNRERLTKCGECHINTIANKDHNLAKNKSYKHFSCPVEKVSCEDCHMPRIVKTGGDFTIRSHAFKIIPPSASIEFQMPNSCQNSGCHSDKSYEEMDKIFKKDYPNFENKILANVLTQKKEKLEK